MSSRHAKSLIITSQTDPGKLAGTGISLPAGTLLNNRYVIEEVLGSGGFSITYTAWDKTLEMRTVVKEYMPNDILRRKDNTTEIILKYNEHALLFKEGIKNFLKEARILARFTDNEGITGVMDYFDENNTAYIVMPYCRGITLKEWLQKKGGRLEYRECIELLIPVMKALAEVNKSGVLHRDISPDNIFITEKNKAVLLDFGASEVVSTAEGMMIQKTPSAMKHGYAPVEQYCYNGMQGPWTDVYAMAATLYHCLSGTVPPPSVKRMHKDETECLCSISSSVPGHVADAVEKALSLSPKDRFPDMDAFLLHLTLKKTRSKRYRVMRYAAGAMILAAGICAGYAISLLQNNDQTIYAGTQERVSETVQTDTETSLQTSQNDSPDTYSRQPAKTEQQQATQTETTKAPTGTIFRDANLEQAVMESLGIKKEILSLDDITDIITLEANNRNIESIDGIEHLSSLSRLDLSNNFIEDIGPLSTLNELGTLYINRNLVNDIVPLKACKSLSELDLCSNHVEDITVLGGLKNLCWLDLNGNRITDFTPLKGLPKLQWLNISGNYAEDISCLAECPSIKELVAEGNGIKNPNAFKDHPTLIKLQH